MRIVVVGLNHKTAPVALLERLTIADDRLPKALHHLRGCEHVAEAAVLSTCNRVEVYAVVTTFHGGAQDLRNFLSEFCHVAPEELVDHLYTYDADAAVHHLFRVAAGIDSLVVGESEILGQVRRAFDAARDEGALGRMLGAAFRSALRTGRRARAETDIARNPASVSSAAVELARRAFDGETLTGKHVVVLGAGKMGRLAARALRRAGVTDVTIVNRSRERASALAAEFDARQRPFEELADALAQADILISSTTAPAPIVDRATVRDALGGRARPGALLVVDIAVPRDVDASVSELSGVVLRDIGDLQDVVESTIGGRLEEVAEVERIVAAELHRFERWAGASEIAPTIAALVARADEIRSAELERAERKLASLSDDERAAVEHMTRRIVAKLLHVPMDRLKELSTSTQSPAYVAAVRELFDLDVEP
ncbi:MAG TPA: glutamyl-tRNA reductase [Actinomycetota bacterium]|nr:glutamyl-tRNA reductase [Actinomycetota bacterium]